MSQAWSSIVSWAPIMRLPQDGLRSASMPRERKERALSARIETPTASAAKEAISGAAAGSRWRPTTRHDPAPAARAAST